MKAIIQRAKSGLKGGLTKKNFDEQSSLAFIERKNNFILLGPSRLGKTHLLLMLGHKARTNGFTAYYISCVDVFERLLKSRRFLVKPFIKLNP